ncbi:MAG: hypothetical protein ACM3ZQ_06320 [Bacillota bacterium]
MTKRLRLIDIGILIVALAGSLWLGYRRASVSQATVDYLVTVSEPANGLVDVKATILPSRGLYLDVVLRDQVQNSANRVKEFSVTRRGEPLRWREISSDRRRISLGWGRGPVEIRYRVDPTWYKGRAPRSLLSSEFGYLRGMVFLYAPVKSGSGDQSIVSAASCQFALPAGWVLNSPLDEQKSILSAEALGNTYFGIGRLATTEIKEQGSVLSIAAYQGLGTEKVNDYLKSAATIYRTMVQTTGFAPQAKADRWALTILPDQTIHGGAAGTGSLVCSDDLGIIAHEAFHWYNGETIDATDEASWLKEGFTTYYQGKLLLQSGMWTEQQMTAYLDGVAAKFERAARGQVVNLSEASRRLIGSSNERDYDLVYYGGALLASHLDQSLAKQGGTLDAIWSLLHAEERIISTDRFVEVLRRVGGDELAEQCAKIVHGEAPIQ